MTGSPGPSEGASERGRVLASFLFFALLLAAYYLLRPVRDSLVAGIGSGAIKYLSTSVLLISLVAAGVYGWLVSRVPRRWLVPGLYVVCALKLIGFALLFRLAPDHRVLAEAFYLWVAVFNLWMVATFWSFMADVWSSAQAERVFGRIAAGGSLGGLVGPWLARACVQDLGPVGLVSLAAALLLLAALVAHGLMRGSAREGYLRFDDALGGGVWGGLQDLWRSAYLRKIALLIACGSVMGMFVYIEVARSAAVLYPTAVARTGFFAERDLWVNALSFGLQATLTPWCMRRLGVGRVLLIGALLVAVSFGALLVVPTAGVLLAANVWQRTVEFGIAKPARDALYTVVPTEAKYKAKSVIDTVLYRGCDSLAGWAHAALTPLGGGLALIGVVGYGIATVSARASVQLGRLFRTSTAHSRT